MSDPRTELAARLEALRGMPHAPAAAALISDIVRFWEQINPPEQSWVARLAITPRGRGIDE